MPESASRRPGRSRSGSRPQRTRDITAIGMFESDYSAMIAAGADDEELREILDRHGLVVAEIEFFFDWAHDDALASRSSAMRENLIHMAEAFRPHHISLGEVRGPARAATARRRRRPIRGGLRPGRSIRCGRGARVPPLVGYPGCRHERRGRRASRSRQRRHLPGRLALLPRLIEPRPARRRRPGTDPCDRAERRGGTAWRSGGGHDPASSASRAMASSTSSGC